MCGKFTQMASWERVHEYSAFFSRPADPRDKTWTTPMRFARVLTLDEAGARVNVAMRWGFLDRRAKSPAERPRHMHARAETIDALPTFAAAFASHRGLLVVSDFNVGQEVAPGKTIQHVVTPRDGKPLGLAVIWERWTHRDEGELLTFVMATVPANSLIAPATDRMPAVIGPDDWAKWLGEEPASPADLKALLRTVEGDWDITVQAKPPKAAPRTQPAAQGDLF